MVAQGILHLFSTVLFEVFDFAVPKFEVISEFLSLPLIPSIFLEIIPSLSFVCRDSLTLAGCLPSLTLVIASSAGAELAAAVTLFPYFFLTSKAIKLGLD